MLDPKLESITHVIYESAYSGNWSSALNQLCDLMQGNKVVMVNLDNRSGQPVIYQQVGMAADFAQLHASTIEDDPVYQCAQRMQAGQMVHSSQLISKQALHRNRYYHEVFHPIDSEYILGPWLVKDAYFNAFVAISRGQDQDDFDRRDAEALEHCAPHIQRALRLFMQLQRTQQTCQLQQSILNQSQFALALLDSGGRVLLVNQAFELFAQRYPLISVQQRQLSSSVPWLQHSLRKGLFNAIASIVAKKPLQGSSILVPACEHWPKTIIDISPLVLPDSAQQPTGSAVLVAIKPQGMDLAALAADMFGLTRAETEVARELVAGIKIDQIAENRSVSVETVRSHVKSLLKKTQTHSQHALVALLSAVRGF